MYLRKYGTGATVNFPLIKRGVVDFATSSDYTYASGDIKIRKDEGASANATNSPTHEGEGIWSLALTATEMEAARITITVVDSATKAVEDQCVIIDTYGNASAQHAFDLNTATQSVNVTQFGGSNGTFASGRPEVNTSHIAGSSVSTSTAQIGVNVVNFGGSAGTFSSGRPEVNATHWGGTAVASANVRANLVQILGTAPTEGGAGRLAGAFTTLLDVATPAFTVASANQTGDSFARIGSTGSGLTSLAPAATALSTATWTGTLATNLATTNSTVATNLDAAISTRLASASYTAPLDAAGTRSAVGLASANLDAQLSAIAGYIDTETTAILADTTSLLTRLTSTRAGYLDNLSAGAVPTLAQILAGGDVDGYTVEETLKTILSVLAGKSSGMGTTTGVLRAADDSKARVTATLDADGNRTAVTIDATG